MFLCFIMTAFSLTDAAWTTFFHDILLDILVEQLTTMSFPYTFV